MTCRPVTCPLFLEDVSVEPHRLQLEHRRGVIRFSFLVERPRQAALITHRSTINTVLRPAPRATELSIIVKLANSQHETHCVCYLSSELWLNEAKKPPV